MGQLEKIKPASLSRLSAISGLHSDGGGLSLRVKDTGSASWVYRYMRDGKSYEMGLGSLAAVSLKKARAKAREIREQRDDGVDPINDRKVRAAKKRVADARQLTFRQCADAYIESHKAGWKNPKHAAQWPSTLKAYVFPTIGDLPVETIDVTLVMRVLEQNVGTKAKPQRLWLAKNETASRVRGRMEAILGWAAARELRTPDNPAMWKGVLEHQLPERSKVAPVKHHAALPYSALPDFFSVLRAEQCISARALELTILTAARTGEIINAPWCEFDLIERVWTVPAARMKASREHKAPLSLAAVRLLKSLPSYRSRKKAGSLVFPGAKAGRPMSNMAMLKLLDRMDYNALTVHGFRSTFRDWVADKTNYHPEIAEVALSHPVANKTEAAYRRGNKFEKRRGLMRAWARYCAGG